MQNMLWHILMTDIIAQGDKNSSNFEIVRNWKLITMRCFVRERWDCKQNSVKFFWHYVGGCESTTLDHQLSLLLRSKVGGSRPFVQGGRFLCMGFRPAMWRELEEPIVDGRKKEEWRERLERRDWLQNPGEFCVATDIDSRKSHNKLHA
mgnify:CR=1 FL=1